MKITKVGKKTYLIDTKTGNIKNFIGTYIIKGEKTAIIETGPTSSISNLLLGLNTLRIKPSQVTYVAVSHIHLDHGVCPIYLLRFFDFNITGKFGDVSYHLLFCNR